MKKVWKLIKDSISVCSDSNSPRLGASLAYYTIFAIAPLLLIVMTIAGFCFGTETARKELFDQVNKLVGHTGGQTIQSMVTAAASRTKAGIWASIAALITFGLGATAVFVELQDALNLIWKVNRPPGHGIKHFIKDRLLSFAMILGVGFLLMVSLLLDAAISAIGNVASVPFHNDQTVIGIVNFVVSLGVITVLFAMIFKWLPDVKLGWGGVWVGALVTGLLFNIGKLLLGYYLGRSSTVSVYGAAGSVVILLTWVYYSAQILFFGAAFTKVHSESRAQARKQPLPQAKAQPAPAHNGNGGGDGEPRHDGEDSGARHVEPRFSRPSDRRKGKPNPPSP